ncbi:hypothetical protein RHMOL_Rhmol09G0057600 [Rhododendron molle]|uniref:Uncharacterized protein n=1 Tax=Rhododendron molle TaxID=49168 RepID=A0ACC0MC39_RHOML|nr:hypothetical protein RHMOL_Rhmol09G0057600 [Rhododendron molle]
MVHLRQKDQRVCDFIENSHNLWTKSICGQGISVIPSGEAVYRKILFNLAHAYWDSCKQEECGRHRALSTHGESPSSTASSPIPKLIFTEPTRTLLSLKQTLSHRVHALALSEALQIPPNHARLIVDTIAVVHYSDCDIEAGGGVDVCVLIQFLYVQLYKRLLPRTHKDSVTVVDVWSSTSAFDGYLSALSPLQEVMNLGAECQAHLSLVYALPKDSATLPSEFSDFLNKEIGASAQSSDKIHVLRLQKQGIGNISKLFEAQQLY